MPQSLSMLLQPPCRVVAATEDPASVLVAKSPHIEVALVMSERGRLYKDPVGVCIKALSGWGIAPGVLAMQKVDTGSHLRPSVRAGWSKSRSGTGYTEFIDMVYIHIQSVCPLIHSSDL